jgi:YggT family protein
MPGVLPVCNCRDFAPRLKDATFHRARVSGPRRKSSYSMRAILDVILAILDIYWFIIIATAVLSWLVAFNVLNIRNDLVRTVWDTLNRLTEPVLRPIRERLPNMGGVDISPIIVLLIIYFIERFIAYYVYPNVL